MRAISGWCSLSSSGFPAAGESVDDLFQVGCVGLIKAIDNFDITQPVKFSTYGVPMIVGEIRRYLRDNSAIRVSRSMRDTAYRVLQAREQLMAENQREPTVEQMAKALDLPREEVVFAMDAIVDPGLPLRPHLRQRRRRHLRDGSGQRHQEYRRALDGAHRAEGCHSSAWISGSGAFSPSAFTRERPRWRSPPRWGSPRRRSAAWKRAPSTPSESICKPPRRICLRGAFCAFPAAEIFDLPCPAVV